MTLIRVDGRVHRLVGRPAINPLPENLLVAVPAATLRRALVLALVFKVEPLVSLLVVAPRHEALFVARVKGRLPELGRATPVRIARAALGLALCRGAPRCQHQEHTKGQRGHPSQPPFMIALHLYLSFYLLTFLKEDAQRV